MSDEEASDDQDKEIAKVEQEQLGNAEDSRKLERTPSVRKKLRALAFGNYKKTSKTANKKRKCSWASKLNCRSRHNLSSDLSESSLGCSSCICTGYKKTEILPNSDVDKGVGVCKVEAAAGFNHPESESDLVADTSRSVEDVADTFPLDDWDEVARQERAKEIEEGIEPPPGYHYPLSQSNSGIQAQTNSVIELSDLTRVLSEQLSFAPYPYLERLSAAAGISQQFMKIWEQHWNGFQIYPAAHTQIDYVHCLVPDLLQITNCNFYWGKMDRYEAEKLLDRKPEGTFLLRDSAQDEYLFSVSFRRYGRTLHARIEQWNHKFSFDSHDPGVFASSTVCGLIEHYKDPSCCMFFEPMLTLPLSRHFVFPLQHLCRAVICNSITYDAINKLNLPRRLKFYLKEYHYKQRVRVRRFDDQ